MKISQSATFYRGAYCFSIPLPYDGDLATVKELYLFAARLAPTHKVKAVKVVRAAFDLSLKDGVTFVEDAMESEGYF